MTNRRNFIKGSTLSGLGALTILPNISFASENNLKSVQISIENHKKGKVYQPLNQLKINTDILTNIEVSDGNGSVYARFLNIKTANFYIAGALGNQTISAVDKNGKVISKFNFKVDTSTFIEDESGTYKELNNVIHWSMIGRAPGMDGGGGLAMPILAEAKFYYFFVPWLRDHVHTLKGMKYYFPDIKSAMELFAKYQREDGMIADNVYYSSKELTMWDKRFSKGGFIWRTPDNKFEFKRIPVEADMEYLFIEGLYFTWKATGDSAWMASLIENALKAVKYNFTDPYRWSQKYGLIKRGYTIDTWDFQSDFYTIEDTDNDSMVIDKDKTKFGIMYGDNTGMVASLRFLAEMLEEINRTNEAKEMRTKANDLQQKIDNLAWNGNFYTHHVPEDSSFKPDFGVNTNEQVSLSNTYSINRGITHDQAVKIIKTYQGIQTKKPKTAPAEWFAIFPPFEKGFDADIWSYMNGGVVSLAAGELAHGAFEHGFEAYGIDILQRILKQAKENNNYIYGCYKGKMPERPTNQKITNLDLKNLVNADFKGNTIAGVVGWTGEGENDLHEIPTGIQTYFDVNFNIINPELNGRKSCLGISNTNGYLKNVVIPVNSKAESIYFLQIKAGDGLAGKIIFKYTDNTESTEKMDDSRITGWWMPSDKPNFKIAWKGKNYKAPSVGVGVCGINNPQPNKIIKEIILKSMDDNFVKWFVMAISISDAPVYLKPNPLSTGIPDKWGAAACMYALAEGLVGIKDTGIGFDKLTLSPRWTATTEKQVSCTLKYEASGGYCAYNYQKNENSLNFQISSSADSILFRALIPAESTISNVKVNNLEVKYTKEKIENSMYVIIEILENNFKNIEIKLI